MRVSVLLFTLAVAAFADSPARATSVTIDFPTAGDTWCEIASATCGTLASGGLTGELKSQFSFITSSGNTYSSLNNFVATTFSATFTINNTGLDTINYSIGGSTVDIPLTECCGSELYTTGTWSLSPILLSSTSPITFTLDDDVGQSNPITGNWIQFGEGTVTLTGYYATPEPSTWALLLLGFGGLGIAGFRTARHAQKIASV
jgi:hypothetical protein